MSDLPRFGQRSDPRAAPTCPRHPGVQSVDYCKRCNRPICVDCMIRTEVRSLCVECAGRNVRSRSSYGQPVVTYTIIGLCVALYLLSWVSSAAWQALAFTPVVGYLQPWRFLTTAFLHSGIAHLGFNMLALYFVGQALESALGRWRYALLYVLSAIGGTLAVLTWVLFAPDTYSQITVGASGAVFGLFAAVFVLQKRAGVDTRSVVALLAVNFLFGLIAANVSWQAHLGGLLTGLVVTWALTTVDKPRAGVTAKAQQLRSVATSVALSAAIIGLIALMYVVIFETYTG